MSQAVTLTYILLSVTLNSVGQLLWRKGAGSTKGLINIMTKPLVITGLMIYACSALLWIIVLSQTEVSYAFPFLALGYGATTILGKTVLNEKVSKKRIKGILVIVTGVILVGLSL